MVNGFGKDGPGPDDVNKDAGDHAHQCRMLICDDGWARILMVVRPNYDEPAQYWGFCEKHVESIKERLVTQQNFKVTELGPPRKQPDPEAVDW